MRKVTILEANLISAKWSRSQSNGGNVDKSKQRLTCVQSNKDKDKIKDLIKKFVTCKLWFLLPLFESTKNALLLRLQKKNK